MPTINSLMAGKQPGEIKICQDCWRKDEWFQPYFKTAVWHGVTNYGNYKCQFDDIDNWQLWQEPVEEVEVFEWMYKSPTNSYWTAEGCLMTEEQAKKFFEEGGEEYRKTGRSWRVPR